MHKVTGHGAPKRGKLRRITIEPSANKGFLVSKHHDPPEGAHPMYMGAAEDPPSAFTSHAPAHKHVRALMGQMHPENEQMEPGLPITGQQS